MLFSAPIPFEEAITELQDKDLLLTDLSTAELREIARELRDSSIFSARMNNAGAVARFQDLVEQILTPAGRGYGEQINIAEARARFQDYLDEAGYDSEKGGFAGEAKVPFAEKGSLRDIASNPRLDLMLKTKVQQMAQAGYTIQQSTPTALRMYPCWELVRVGVLKHPDQMRDWPARWIKVGGELHDGRMIAPKDSTIWDRIGSSEFFDDALDTSTPPYAFNSHMTRRAVARDVCIALGVIPHDFTPKGPKGSPILATAQASALPFDKSFLADLRRDLGAEVEAGRIRLAAQNADPLIAAAAAWLTSLAINSRN